MEFKNIKGLFLRKNRKGEEKNYEVETLKKENMFIHYHSDSD
jgi:hypothetical protein